MWDIFYDIPQIFLYSTGSEFSYFSYLCVQTTIHLQYEKMAKKKKNTDPIFERLKQEMPEDLKKKLEEEGINSMEDMFLYFVAMGYDPVKITTPPEDGQGN